MSEQPFNIFERLQARELQTELREKAWRSRVLFSVLTVISATFIHPLIPAIAQLGSLWTWLSSGWRGDWSVPPLIAAEPLADLSGTFLLAGITVIMFAPDRAKRPRQVKIIIAVGLGLLTCSLLSFLAASSLRMGALPALGSLAGLGGAWGLALALAVRLPRMIQTKQSKAAANLFVNIVAAITFIGGGMAWSHYRDDQTHRQVELRGAALALLTPGVPSNARIVAVAQHRDAVVCGWLLSGDGATATPFLVSAVDDPAHASVDIPGKPVGDPQRPGALARLSRDDVISECRIFETLPAEPRLRGLGPTP